MPGGLPGGGMLKLRFDRYITIGYTNRLCGCPVELLEWGRTFSDFGGKKALHNYGWQTYQNVCTVGDKLSFLHSI